MSAPIYQQQPTATMGMVVAPGGGNRNGKALPVGPDGRDWSHDFCGCFNDCGTCELAFDTCIQVRY